MLKSALLRFLVNSPNYTNTLSASLMPYKVVENIHFLSDMQTYKVNDKICASLEN